MVVNLVISIMQDILIGPPGLSIEGVGLDYISTMTIV